MQRKPWWTEGMVDAWANGDQCGLSDMDFAQAVAPERARRRGRRQRVVVNRGHAFREWRLAIIDAPEVAEPCS